MSLDRTSSLAAFDGASYVMSHAESQTGGALTLTIGQLAASLGEPVMGGTLATSLPAGLTHDTEFAAVVASGFGQITLTL